MLSSRSTGESDFQRRESEYLKRYTSEKQRVREYIEKRLRLGDFEERSHILRDAQVEFPWAPSRSTFYEWVRNWDGARSRDASGAWTLAADETGRPDIVMDVLAALMGATRGRAQPLTAAEARWVVRLATAVPDIRRDGLWSSTTGRRPDWGSLNVWSWALQYVEAEASDDAAKLAELDEKVATLYGAGGRHFPEWARPADQSLEDLYAENESLWPDGWRALMED